LPLVKRASRYLTLGTFFGALVIFLAVVLCVKNHELVDDVIIAVVVCAVIVIGVVIALVLGIGSDRRHRN